MIELKPGYRVRLFGDAKGYGKLCDLQNQLGYLTVKNVDVNCSCNCPNCDRTTTIFKGSTQRWCHVKNNGYYFPLKITKPITFRQYRVCGNI